VRLGEKQFHGIHHQANVRAIFSFGGTSQFNHFDLASQKKLAVARKLYPIGIGSLPDDIPPMDCLPLDYNSQEADRNEKTPTPVLLSLFETERR
jgi:hypothetical protein